MIRNSGLKPGTPITLLHGLFDNTKAQTPAQLAVGPKAATDCDKRHGGIGEAAASFYAVSIPSSMKSDPPNAVVYVGGKAAQTPSGWLLGGTPSAVRTCVSNEGVNATLWSGKPLGSPRLWHFYYYLGADSEPNCKSGDSELSKH